MYVYFQYIWLCQSSATIIAICGYRVNVMWSRYPDLRLEITYAKYFTYIQTKSSSYLEELVARLLKSN